MTGAVLAQARPLVQAPTPRVELSQVLLLLLVTETSGWSPHSKLCHFPTHDTVYGFL